MEVSPFSSLDCLEGFCSLRVRSIVENSAMVSVTCFLNGF